MQRHHSRLGKRNQEGNVRNNLSQKIYGTSRIRKDKPPVNQLLLTGDLKDNQAHAFVSI
jgi:hypothetical protein